MKIDASISSYLDDAAGGSPTPGGGSVSALAGALGAAMASMAANFTIGREKYKEVEAEAKTILKACGEERKILTRLVDEDVHAYKKVSSAAKMPKTSQEEKLRRSGEIQRAYKEALSVPLEIVGSCLSVLKLAGRLAEVANPNLITDVGVSALLANAALLGAALNVRINLKGINDEKMCKETEGILSSLCEEGKSVFGKAMKKVEAIA